MGKAMILFGHADGGSPTPATAEAAAFEYFTNRQLVGNYVPRPRIARWRPEQRQRFTAELQRLEAERLRQSADAADQAARRP